MSDDIQGTTPLLIEQLMDRGFLVSPDCIENLTHAEGFSQSLRGDGDICILTKDIVDCAEQISSQEKDLFSSINWKELDRCRVAVERGGSHQPYRAFLQVMQEQHSERGGEAAALIAVHGKGQSITVPEAVEVVERKASDGRGNVTLLKMNVEDGKKRAISDFVSCYRKRYESLRKILLGRPQLVQTLSIQRLAGVSGGEEVTVIGMVYDKRMSKQGHVLLTLEDLSGQLGCFVSKEGPAFLDARDLTFDEVVGVTGKVRNNRMFVSEIFKPDVPNNGHGRKRAVQDGAAAFISDIHVGSKGFHREEFLKFISWLNGEYGDERQRSLGKNVKYLFFVGDLVDGVGVYPQQEKELAVPDIRQQYIELASYLAMIRKDCWLIIMPGNHDASRNAEPQPGLDKDYCPGIHALENALLVTNPCIVNVHSEGDFEGFNVLLYHGASFYYYMDNIDGLRATDPKNNPRHMMKFLLQRRHLAPTHSSSLFLPSKEGDCMVIEQVPDIFVCGDLHRTDVSSYNGVVTVNCSCWQRKTSFQEKTGNNPDPCKVPVINLKTREVSIINFLETDTV